MIVSMPQFQTVITPVCINILSQLSQLVEEIVADLLHVRNVTTTGFNLWTCISNNVGSPHHAALLPPGYAGYAKCRSLQETLTYDPISSELHD